MRTRSLINRSAILAMMLALGACAGARTGDGDLTGSLPDDHRARHPIYVTRGAATLDLLPGGGPGGLTDRQVGDIQEFGRDWQKRGRGRLVIHVPTGGDPVTDRQSAYAAKEIRRVLSGMGISDREVATERYAADGPQHLAPVRLEFPVLEAKVPHECGQWPDDLGYGLPRDANSNRSYWNFGCAYQQNLAAQVEDPEDFIRPRAESPASATRRATVIDAYAKGETTSSSAEQTTISTQEQ